MQIVELKVQVEKSQLAALEAQVKALQSKTITIRVNTTGVDAKALNAVTNYTKALAANERAKAAVTKANAALVRENNRLAVEQQKTTQAMYRHSAQVEKTRQSYQKTQQTANRLATEQTKLNRVLAQGARQQAQGNRAMSGAAGGYQNATKQVSAFQRVMGMSLKQTVGQMAAWTALSAAINAPIRAMKYAISTMKEVDSQLVQIQKVTNFSTRQMKEIEEQAYSTASKYGQSADTYLEAVAAFSRAGYKEQADDRGELAVKTMLVGDTTAEVVDQFLLSVDKAYKYNGEIQKLSQVLDGADYLNNNYATSLEKIAEGMGIVAPIAAQAHVGVDELMAGIGTITAVTQRTGSESARALRALFLNIIGDTKTEIEDGVTWTAGEIKDLHNILKKYAPDIVEEADRLGQVIDPMEAIGALHQAFEDGTLNEAELMEKVSDIGGKLRSAQLMALIQNWDMYTQMVEDYKHAAGTADKEISYIVDSWEGRLNILKNTWTEFVSHLVNSDAIKGAISGLTGFIDVLDSKAGQTAVKLTAFTLAMTGVSKAISAIGASAGLASLMKFFGLIAEGSFAAAFAPIASLLTSILPILGAIGLLWATDEATVSLKEQKKAVQELEDAYNALYGEGSELDQLRKRKDGGETLTSQEERRLALLTAQAEQMERQLKAEKEFQFELFNREMGTDSNRTISRRDREGNPIYETSEDALRKDEKATNDLKEAYNSLSKSLTRGSKSVEEYKDGISGLITDNADLYDTLKQFDEWGMELDPIQREFLDLYDSILTVSQLDDRQLGVTAAIEAFSGVAEIGEKSAVNWKGMKKAMLDAGATAEEVEGTLHNLTENENVIVIDIEADTAETTIENLKELGIAVEEAGETKIDAGKFAELATELGLSGEEAKTLAQSMADAGVTFVDAEGNAISLSEALRNVGENLTGNLIDSLNTLTNSIREAAGLPPIDFEVNAEDNASPVLEQVEQIGQTVNDSQFTGHVGAIDEASPTIGEVMQEANQYAASNPTAKLGASNGASPTIATARADAQGFATTYTATLAGNDGPIQAAVARAKSAIQSLFSLSGKGPGGGTAGSGKAGFGAKATGDVHFQGGPVLLGDELSGDGSPRPELVITPTGKSFLAGTTGPVATILPAGSRIFKYSDTMDVFSGQDITPVPGFSKGNTAVVNAYVSAVTSGSGSGSGSGGGGGSGSGGSGKGGSGSGGGSGGSGKGGSGSGSGAGGGSGRGGSGSGGRRGSGGSGKGGSSSSDKDAYLESLEDQLAVLRAQYDFLEASDAETGDLIAKSQEIQAHLHTINEYLRSTGKNEEDVWKNSADWWKELKEIQELQKKVFEDEQGLLESQLKLLEHHDYTYGDQIDKHKQIQDSLHREAEYLRSIGAEQEEINKLSLKWWETQEDILKVQGSLWDELDNAVQNELKKAQEARDDEVAAIDAELKRMQDERDLQQEQVDLEEKRKKVEEARFALENAQMERNVRFYNSATGQWEWGANRSDVESAQKSLEDAEKELKDAEADLAYDEAVKAMERRKEAINAAYDTLEASWNKITESLQEPSREISVILADIAKHGTPEMKRQIDNVTQMLARLGNFVVGAIDPTTGESYVGGGGTPSMDFSSDTTDYNWLMMNSTSEAEFQHWASLRDAKMKAKGIVPGVSTYGNGSVYETNADLYSAWKSGNYDLTQKSYYGYTSTAQAEAAAEASRQSAARSLAEAARSLAESTNSNNLRDSRKAHSKSEEGAAAAAKALSERYRAAAAGTYDSGGVLYGLGGIKATSRNEVVIPPDVADYILRPSANATFRRRMSELGYLYGATDRLPVGAQGTISGGRSSSDHYGDVYKFGNVTLSEKQARSTTVYELAQMSRSLGIYNHT